MPSDSESVPPGSGPRKPEGVQEEAVRTLVERAGQARFSQLELAPQVDSFVEILAAACPDTESEGHMLDRLRPIVRRFRLPGRFLSFWMQLLTHRRRSPFHILACRLYADAQTHFAESLAIQSLENAWSALVTYPEAGRDDLLKPVALSLANSQLPELTAVQSLEGMFAASERLKRAESAPSEFLYEDITGLLHEYHAYYARWSRGFGYSECNPLTEHLYWERTYRDLKLLHPVEMMPAAQPGGLLHLIEQLRDQAHLPARLAARRVLAVTCQENKDLDAAAKQFGLGLEEAIAANADAEIGHMLRGLAYAQYLAGEYGKAGELLEQAAQFELQHQAFRYWAALSLAELGDVRLHQASKTAERDAATLLRRNGLSAHRTSRQLWEQDLATEVIPVDRVVKQQLFRSYRANALSAACSVPDPRFILTEIEATNPREAGELMTEMRAAREMELGKSSFREGFAVFQKHLTSVPDTFEDYLRSLLVDHDARLAYLKARAGGGLTNVARAGQDTEATIDRLLASELQGVVILAFDVGMKVTTVGIVDPARKALVGCGRLELGERDYAEIHARYVQALELASTLVGPNQERARREALERLLADHEETVGALLEQQLPLLKGRQLKILPRQALNAVPWHALRVLGQPLVEHCDVSYAPSLQAVLSAHDRRGASGPTSVLMVHDDATTPCFEATAHGIADVLGKRFTRLCRPAWSAFLETSRSANGELFLACHGSHAPLAPAASCVWFDRRSAPPSTFAQFLTDFDPSRFETVVLGACDSGMVRAEVAAECVGLPTVFLAGGVRYVISSLWKASQLATAVLLEQYYRERHAKGPVAALCSAQRAVVRMTREDVAGWIGAHPFPKAGDHLRALQRMDPAPFAHPLFWAALEASGDA